MVLERMRDFSLIWLGLYREKGRKEEEKKKKEEGRREEEIQVWNCLEICYSCLKVWNFGLEYLFRFETLVFVSMEPICMVLLVRKPFQLFLCLCLGFEELYLCIKVNYVGFSSVLWLVLSWFSFGWKISSENGQNWPFL